MAIMIYNPVGKAGGNKIAARFTAYPLIGDGDLKYNFNSSCLNIGLRYKLFLYPQRSLSEISRLRAYSF